MPSTMIRIGEGEHAALKKMAMRTGQPMQRILSAAILDPAELGACIAAWNKRLMIHLDMLLAVYGSTEGSAHWY